MIKRLIARFRNSAVAEPEIIVPDKALWQDEGLLRILGAESDRGFCKWVLASDMAELFKKLDAYNASQPAEKRVEIELNRYVADWINEMRAKGMHDHAQTMTMMPKGERISLDGDMYLRVMGPQAFGGLRLRMGGEVREAAYAANPINSCIRVQTGPETWKEIHFGMDTPRFFTPAAISTAPGLFPPSA